MSYPVSRFKRLKAVRAVAIAAGIGVVLAGTACSNSGGSSDDGPSGDVPEAVSAAVEEIVVRPTSIGLAEHDKPVPKGKTIAFVQCSVPSCVVLGDYLKEAASSIGWDVKVLNAGDGSDPLKVKQAWEQAVRLSPDAVMGTGFPRNIMEDQIQALHSADIPVIMAAVTDPAEDGITVSLNSSEAFAEYGRSAARYVISRRGVSEETNAVYLHTPGFPIQSAAMEAFKEEYEKSCGPCSFDVMDVPSASIGTDLPQRVAGYLQANPDVNTVVPGFSDLAQGLPNALRAASLNDQVKTMVTIDVNPTVNSYIEAGTLDAAVHEGWEMWMWRAVDVVIRNLNGDLAADGAEGGFPSWIVTADTLPSVDDNYPMVADYQEQFKAAWGVN